MTLLLLLSSFYVCAQEVTIPDGDIVDLRLRHAVEIASTNDLTPPTAGWQLYSAETEPGRKGTFWSRVLLNSERNEVWQGVLYLHNLQAVEASLLTADGNKKTLGTSGIFQPVGKRDLPYGNVLYGIGNSVQLPIGIPPGRSGLYLRIEHTLEEVLDPEFRLISPQQWQSTIATSRQRHLFIQGAIGGALILMGFYHLLIAFLRKSKPYFWYSVYTIFMALILWHETGILQATAFPDHLLPLRLLQKTQTPGLIGTVLYCTFLRSFVDLKSLIPWLDRFILYCLAFVVVCGIPYLWAYGTYRTIEVNSFGYFISLFTLLISLVVFIPMYRAKDVYAQIAIYGSAALVIGVLGSTLLALSWEVGWLSSPPVWGVYLTEAGVIVELIIFAFGLGYRSNQEAKEKERLEELGKLKSNFFANITHEFRTPLTVIGGMADQIKGHGKEKELIRRNADTLMKLVNELLDLSLTDAGALKLQWVQSDAVAYLRYLTESFYSMAEEANVRLMFYPEVTEVKMDLDEDVLQKIITNLLSNAIKFTDAKGKVVLHVKRAGEELEIRVQDTGIGMDAEELDQVFERYFRTTPASSNHRRGSGIGLSLTRELVVAIGGRIMVKSELGKGSTFTLYLPITNRAVAADLAPSFMAQEVVSVPGPEFEEETSASGPVILLVEDNPDVTTYLSDLLGTRYTFHSAGDGLAGLDAAIDLVPDLIISDVMMPLMNGFELCEKLRVTPATTHIPLILLTAKSTRQDKISGLLQGADDYLTKPFDKQELLLKIRNLLARMSYQRKYYEGFSFATPIPAGKHETEPALAQILALIEERLGDASFSVREISDVVQLGRTQINRKMKALTGYTTSGFISEQRLRKAEILLKSGDLLVNEVAYEVGFSDPNYFTRVFTRRFGCTPSSLRE